MTPPLLMFHHTFLLVSFAYSFRYSMHAYGHAVICSLHCQFTIIQDIYVDVYGHVRPNGNPWCLVNSQIKSLEQMTHTFKAFRTYIFYKVRLHDFFAELA